MLDHPPVNALDSAGWNELADDRARPRRATPSVRCLLVRGEGKGFCAGVDIKEMQAHPERIVELNRGNFLTFKAIRAAEVPVVTAVHGFVIGGGIGICGASDVIIAADDAYFSLPEVDRGAMGGASHLLRMLPLHKVRAALLHRPAASPRPKRTGSAPSSASCRATSCSTRRARSPPTIAAKSRRALVLAKEALNGIEPRDVDHGYRFEQGFTLEMYLHPDSQKARDAFVEHKGTAKY